MYKIAIYFNAEAQGRRVRRGSWSLELELESGGLGVRGQESVVGVRSQGLDSGVGGGAKVRANGYGVFAEVP